MAVHGKRGNVAFLWNDLLNNDEFDSMLFACTSLRPLFPCWILVFLLYRDVLVIRELNYNFIDEDSCGAKTLAISFFLEPQ